jgi:ornithine cyclodeaminase
MRTYDAAATRERLPFPGLIDALRRAWIEGAEVPPRQIHRIDGDAPGSLLIMPAWRAGRRLGVKTVTVFPGNAARGVSALHAVYTLFDATDGTPIAQIDGHELTTRRTAAASALAASMLARRDASRLLLVGAGAVAHAMPEAMRAVRPIAGVQIWNHRPERAQALAATLRDEGFDATAVTDLEAAVREAHIVSCATLSDAPLVRGDWLAPGSHLDLVGSFTPQMREADARCFARASVWVDHDEAIARSGDLLEAAREGTFAAPSLCGTLADLARGAAGRRDDTEITLFKSVGHAIEDLAAAELVVDAPVRAREVRLYWEDFVPGQAREFGAMPVTRDAVLSFAAAFDPQPFHLDDAAAEASLFKRLSASGWHTCAMAMRMLCDHYLLESSSLGSPGIDALRWLLPVYPGDRLSVRFTPLESRPMASRPTVGLVRSRWEVLNQQRETVLTMEGWGMFGRRHSAAQTFSPS